MKYLLGLLIVVCVGWQSCANDNNIIENYSSQKCGMTPEEVEVKIEHAEGLAECKKMLTLAKIGKKNGCLIEGMGCPGGCIAGAGTNIPIQKAQKELKDFVAHSSKMLPPKELEEIELK